VPNAKAKLPGPPASTLKPENQDGGPGQLRPLVSFGRWLASINANQKLTFVQHSPSVGINSAAHWVFTLVP
jgi:hypothetical protein